MLVSRELLRSANKGNGFLQNSFMRQFATIHNTDLFEESVAQKPIAAQRMFEHDKRSTAVKDFPLEITTNPALTKKTIDHITGEDVEYLTTAGLLEYENIFRMENPDLSRRTVFIVDPDEASGPNFSESTRQQILHELSQNRSEPTYFIISRSGHTSFLVKEGDLVMLFDSYNAHGAKDADHLPLLELVREANPTAQIYTNNDKYQTDYSSCKVFSIEGVKSIDEYLQRNKLHLLNLIEERHIGMPKFYTQRSLDHNIENTKDKSKLSTLNTMKESFILKEERYRELGVKTIGLPIPVAKLCQNYRLLPAIKENCRQKDPATYTQLVQYLGGDGENMHNSYIAKRRAEITSKVKKIAERQIPIQIPMEEKISHKISLSLFD